MRGSAQQRICGGKLPAARRTQSQKSRRTTGRIRLKFHLAAITTALAFILPALAQSPAPYSKLIERGAYLANGIAA